MSAVALSATPPDRRSAISSSRASPVGARRMSAFRATAVVGCVSSDTVRSRMTHSCKSPADFAVAHNRVLLVFGVPSQLPSLPGQEHGRTIPLAEVALPHSITSSTRTRNDSGIVSPSALAVVRLTTRSNFVGCSTGISPGFVPRRILSTKSAARWNRAGKLGP